MTRSVTSAGDTAASPVSELQHATDTEVPMVPRSTLAAAGLELAAWHNAFPYGSPADARARKELAFAAAVDARQVAVFLLTCDYEEIERSVFCALIQRIHDLADTIVAADDETRTAMAVGEKVYWWGKVPGVML